MKRENRESLFVRFRHGSPTRIQMDTIETLDLFVKESKNDNGPLKTIRRLSTHTNGSTDIDSTWLRLIEECYLVFDNGLSGETFAFSLLTDYFNLLLSSLKTEDKWLTIRRFILEHVDQLSMWDFLYNKRFAKRNIIRQDDGTYIEITNHERCQIIGIKTLEEERFDYVMSVILNEHGSIYNLLKFAAIIFIVMDYKENPNAYPQSLSIYLPEADNSYWFLRWKWYLERPYGYAKSGWRPNNNHCDPDWLGSDLLAKYSENIIPEVEINRFELPEDEILRQYEDAFEGFPRQFACTLESDLIIGEKAEIYFSFKNKKIRWINGTASLHPILVIPSHGQSTEDETMLNEFISALVWETGIPIRTLFYAGAVKRFLPIVGPSKNRGGILLGAPELTYDGTNVNKNQTLALALYKEGINSKSIYYSFLSYYKIIELLFQSKNDIINFINDSRDLLIISSGSNKARVAEIATLDKDLGNYMYLSCRCAVAHARQPDNTINPDNIDDYRRLTKDLPLIQEMAKHTIKSGKFNI